MEVQPMAAFYRHVPNVATRNSINVSQIDAGLLIYLSSSGCLQLWNGTSWENIKCSSEYPNPPTLLGLQNFEFIQATPTLSVTGLDIANYQTGSGPFPNNLPRYVSPLRGYGINNGITTLTFGPVDTSQYTFAIINFHLASFSTTNAQGADITDNVVLSISRDGGLTFSDELIITGYNNSKWGFNNTNIALASYKGNNSPDMFQSSGVFSSGIGNVELKNIPAATSIFFQIRMSNDFDQEIWIIDDVKVSGL